MQQLNRQFLMLLLRQQKVYPRDFQWALGRRTRGYGRRKSPSGVQGQSPWWGIGGETSKAEHFC